MQAILILLSLVACSDGTANALADYDSLMTEMSTLVSDHRSAVAAATTLDEAGTAEDAYLSDWGTLRDDMSRHMDMMGGCSMDESDQGMMDDADASMMGMDTAVSDHVAAHAAHADIAECQAEETEHAAMMNEDIAMMAGYSEEWSDSMQCSSGGMSSM